MGVVVGRYKLLRRIAVGGMAEIFLAAVQGEAGFERKVIIKKVLPMYARESEFVRRLVDEGLLASRLNHGNIVQTLDLGKIGPDYFIAMEFVDGVDMRDLMQTSICRQFIVPPPIGLHILWQAARGLAYAHDKKSSKGESLNIVHRDISPANIFVSWEGVVKLGDFGIAKASQRLSRQTMTGVLQGKFPYMSPEQAEGKPLNQRSDIFSFGCVAYELLTQKRPFEGDSDLGILAAIQRAESKPIRQCRSDLPPEIEEIVHTCLRRDPAQRYARGAELERTLATAMQRNGWVVGESDVADFLSALYGESRRSLADQSEEVMNAGEIVEASPLDPWDLRAGLPEPAPAREQRPPPREATRAVPSPSWRERDRKRRLRWALWSFIMLLVAGALALDYLVFHFLLGTAPEQEVPVPSPSSVPSPPAPLPPREGLGVRDIESPPTLPPGEGLGVRDIESPPTLPPGEGLGVRDMESAPTPERSPLPPGEGLGVRDVESAPTPGDATLEPEKEIREEESRGKSSAVVDQRARSMTRISALPDDARILVDGVLLGTQPQGVLVLEGEPSKSVRIEKEGYLPEEFPLAYPSPRILSKRLERAEFGKIHLRYFPASAEVFIDGRSVAPTGEMNTIERQLPLGDHEITVKSGGKETSEVITVRKDKEWRGTIAVEP